MTEISTLPRPIRRQLQGKPCPLCGLAMFHTEIVALTEDGEMQGISHFQCGQLLIERQKEEKESAAQSGEEAKPRSKRRKKAPVVEDSIPNE